MTVRFRSMVLAALMVTTASPALACEAEGFVLNAGNAFLAAAGKGTPQAFSSAAARYADLNAIALVALGPHRKFLPKSRQGEYISLARSYMGKFMAKNAASFTGTGLKITNCSGNIVNAATAGGRKIAFRVTKAGRGFRVQDVSVQSIWLAGQMRSKFVGIINQNNGDINALFEFLRK